MTIQILEWTELVAWQWDFDDDNCCICQDSIDSCCPNCQYPGEKCPPIVGQCGHIFHKHCLQEWIDEHESCPMCRASWKEVKFMETE